MKTTTYRKRHHGIPINRKQITVIKLACNLLQIDDDTYRAMLARYNVTSCTMLTYDQAGEFIRELEGKGFALIPKKGTNPRPRGEGGRRPGEGKPRPPIPRTGNVVALVTPDELDKIDQLAKVVPWREANGLALFLEKRMGLKNGQVRTSKDAYIAIEGLKKMIANGMKKAYGADWWRKTYSNPDLNEFIRIHKSEQWR